MLSEPVPCVNATSYEVRLNKHMTWEDDRRCTTCKRILDLFDARRAVNEQYVGEPDV